MNEKRLHNVVRRMCRGVDFYTNRSPRITLAEMRHMEGLGFRLQRSHVHGAEVGGPIAVYPLFKREFAARAKELGLVE